MSYQPLHLKYRPQVLSDCIGQNAIVRTLTNAIENQQLAPAYLFFGGRGTGKTSTARIFAKSLNCLSQDKPTSTPCNKCKLCLDIAAGNAVDVAEIDGATSTGVEAIRKIADNTQLAPVESRYKVIVIDEVHMISTQSFNALLKTLEDFKNKETVFILATTDPQKIPDTVVSRCQSFNFKQIAFDEIFGYLKNVSDKEQIKVEDDALKIVAKLSNGGMRDALVMLDQIALNSSDKAVNKSEANQILGVVSTELVFNIVSAIVNSQVDKIIDGVRVLMDQGKDCLTITNVLAQFYVDALKAQTINKYDEKISNIDEPTWHKVKELFKNVLPQSLVAAQKEIKSWESQLKQSTDPRLCLEIGILGLMPSDAKLNQALPTAPTKAPQVGLGVVQPSLPVAVATKSVEVIPDILDALLPKTEWELVIFNINDSKIRVLFSVSIQFCKINWAEKKVMVSLKCSEKLKALITKHRSALEQSFEETLLTKLQIVFVFV